LIVDDGVASRGHRNNIFNPAFKVGANHSCDHKVYKNTTVMNYAGGFLAPGEEDPMMKQMQAAA
jgi:uncharacterized protein YkwD